jgi:hypothetical protein
VTHYGGQSTSQLREEMFVELYRSRLLLYDRYHGPLTRRLYRWLVRRGIGEERFAQAARPRHQSPPTADPAGTSANSPVSGPTGSVSSIAGEGGG